MLTRNNKNNSPPQTPPDISFLVLRPSIGFNFSFLLTNIIANNIKTFTAPTYTRIWAAATKLAFSKRYKPATAINTPPNKNAE